MTPPPLVTRLASIFVTASPATEPNRIADPAAMPAPADARRRRSRTVAVVVPAPRVLVVGSAGSGPFCVALAGALTRRGSGRAGIACLPAGSEGPWWPVVPGVAARRLAGRLAAREHAVRVRGNVVAIATHGPPGATTAEAARAAAAAPGCPVVVAVGDEIAIGSGRDGETRALAAHDLVVVAARPGALAGVQALALSAVQAAAPQVRTCAIEVPTGLMAGAPRLGVSEPVAAVLRSLS